MARTDQLYSISACIAAKAAVLLTVIAASATAQISTRSFYNEQGPFVGQAFTRGNSTSDGQDRFSGSAIKHGGGTSFHDARGRYQLCRAERSFALQGRVSLMHP